MKRNSKPIAKPDTAGLGLGKSSSKSKSSGGKKSDFEHEAPDEKGEYEHVIRELDWLHESRLFLSSARTSSTSSTPQSFRTPPNLILACDCLYNPSLSEPLAHTLTSLSVHSTLPDPLIAMIASELRDPEPLEVFLKAWLEDGWKVVRIVFEEGGGREGKGELKEGLEEGRYVVWIGWIPRPEEGAAAAAR